MTRRVHSDLAAGRWQTFTVAEQLAHVGSEVDRAIRGWEVKRSERFEGAFIRALELFDLTASDGRWRGPRRREILRLREEFCQLFFPLPGKLSLKADLPPESVRSLQGYFLQLGVLARLTSSSR